MTIRVEVARNWSVIVESDVSDVLRDPGSEVTPCLTVVQRRVERAGTGDMIGTMMGGCEDGFGEVGARAATLGGAREQTRLEGEVREETVDQKDTRVVSLFEGGVGQFGDV